MSLYAGCVTHLDALNGTLSAYTGGVHSILYPVVIISAFSPHHCF